MFMKKKFIFYCFWGVIKKDVIKSGKPFL
jgi:hypothetical protein